MTERTADWWKSAVVYQVYPRSFADSDGDGIGDVRGIIQRLDYLQRLGVDVVWVSPIFKSPQDDNGYDISDYQDIDPTFGTLADVDELITEMHQRDMKLVMDLVVNHTSDEHPWFVESRDPNSPKRDWYWWKPARDGMEAGTPGAEPTNWQSAFSGSAWQYDERSGEYFLHLFSKKQPDLNWENPEVRQAVYSMMRWWIDRGVDGFRMDVINLISKPEVMRDGDGFMSCANGPRIHEFLQEMNREALAGRNLITVGETGGVTTELAKLYSDPTRNELNMVFQFQHMHLDQAGPSKWDLAPLELVKLKENLSHWERELAGVGWNSLFWDNHDQPRIVSRWGNDREYRVPSAKALATVLHLMQGTPYVYQGEELGMTNAGFTDLAQYRDLESVNWANEALASGADPASVMRSLDVKSRDNARTPMQWDGTAQAGFTSGTPWIAVNPNYIEVNAAAALADPDSVFHHYRRLIEMRHRMPIVVHGEYRLLLPDHDRVFAYTRTLREQRLLVLANLSDDVVTLALDGDLAGFAGRAALIGAGVTWSDDAVSLQPWASAAF